MRRIGPLNIMRFIATAMLILGSFAAVGGGTTASAATTTYHAYCDQNDVCQSDPDQAIFITQRCDSPCDYTKQTAYEVRSQSTAVVLDKLVVKTTTGTYTKTAADLANCNYNHLCYFQFEGRSSHADLYGHSGTASNYSVSAGLTPVVMPVGQIAHLHGSVAPSAGGQTVYAQRYYSGTWHTTGSQKLNSSSAYSFATKPSRGTYQFRVYKPAAGGIKAAYSSTQTLWVGVYRVTGAFVDSSISHTQTATFNGVVAPARGGQRIYIQQYYSGTWHNVSYRALTSNSSYSFGLHYSTSGTFTYRTFKPGDGTYSGGYSPARVIKVS